MVSEDPQALLHKRMDLLVRIPYARGVRWVQDDQTRGLVCRYKFYTDSKMRSTKSIFHTMNPNFSYAKQFTIKDVSDNFLEYLKSSALVIEMWGKQGDGKGPNRRLSKLRTMSASSAAGEAADEARMDAVITEMDWRAERLALQGEIEALRQEVQLLQVEKSSLEKELSVTTLRANSSLPSPSAAAGLGESFQQLLHLHSTALRKVTEVNGELKLRNGKMSKEARQQLEELERAYNEQVTRIRQDLDSFAKAVCTPLALLLKARR